jgi:hypothetical protein
MRVWLAWNQPDDVTVILVSAGRNIAWNASASSVAPLEHGDMWSLPESLVTYCLLQISKPGALV